MVDFPAPFGPTNPVTCPGLTSNVIPSSARVLPKRLPTFLTSIVARDPSIVLSMRAG